MSSLRRKTLLTYVIPATLTSACLFLFTVVDGIFVGQGVGTAALGAVNMAAPFTLICAAAFMLSSIGGVTITAIRLGRGDQKGANQAFMHSFSVTVLLAVILSAAGVFLTTPIARLLGANEDYLPMVKDYLFWYSLFIIPNALSVNLQSFCRNDGSPSLVAIATVVGTLFNVFADWLFVFPMKMGLMGAALATGLSQFITLVIILTHFVKKKGVLRFGRFKASKALYGKLVFRGLPEMIAQLATPVTTIFMNRVLLEQIGDIGVNAYAVINYVASFTLSILLGCAEGLQPLFGQSYGAKNEKDLKYYLRAGAAINLVGSMVIIVLILLFDRDICALFNTDAQTMEFAVQSMPQYVWGFVVAGMSILISAYLYSTKRSKQAILLNVMRSLVVNTIIIQGLPALLGKGIVWYTFGIYECIVLVLAIILLKYSERNGIEYK